MCFMKWSWNTRMLATQGSWFSSMAISILVKFICKRSNGVVATIGCRGTLDKSPWCCKQCMQDLVDCHIWLIIPSHQRHSYSNDNVWSWFWWPEFLWHPFRTATWWALGTTNSSRSSVSPLGIEHRYRAPWWIIKFCQFHTISCHSSLEVCSTRSAFKSVFSCAFSPSKTALNMGSSLWALAQSITSICTSAWPAVTCTSFSKLRSRMAMAGLCTSAQCATPIAASSRIDLTMSGSSWVVTQLSMSATVLSCPFWYSSLKLNHTRAPTHQWPVALWLGIIIM